MAKFSVAARTLVHLGAELITSDEVAINELIKNAFDAESRRIKIDFHTAISKDVVDAAIAKVKEVAVEQLPAVVTAAKISIMELIDNLPSGLEKDELISKLSSLDSQSSAADVISMLEGLNYITVEDSGSGMSREELESVFLTIGTPSRLSSQTSENLHRKILGNKGIGRLAMMRLGDCATVSSWAAGMGAHSIHFNWREFDDPEKQIDEVVLSINAIAPPRETSSGTIITISALKTPWTEQVIRSKFIDQFVRRLQNPFTSAEEKRKGGGQGFPIDIHLNYGARIPIQGMKPELADHKQIDFSLNFDPAGFPDASGSVLTTDLMDYQRGNESVVTRRTIEEVARKVAATDQELRKIGPFRATIRWFNRDQLREQTTLHGSWKAARTELDLWSGGIAIYRDGFRVGFTGQSTGEDWLGLDRSALQRGGFVVNRIQVVGALEISRANNPGLVDRSNREGLIESREAFLVREVLLSFAVDELRRYIEHEGRQNKKEALDAIVESAPATIKSRAEQAEKSLMEIRAKVSDEVKGTIQSISDHLHFIKTEVKAFEDASKKVGERREDILELAGVGTVMSGLLHELTRTTGHTRQLMQKLSKDRSPETRALLDKLHAEIKAINTRLRQLDPLTPSGRHRKEKFNLTALLKTIVDGYDSRFLRHDVKCELSVAGDSEQRPVVVNMVRGFVSLAVENLLTNSMYWVQQGLRAGESERRIFLELDPKSKTLTVGDNGPGISPADKDRIFTAGFSMRPRGQGLGLFIAAEVASYHEAKLTLDSADNDGRYRTFVLELPRE